MTKFIYADHSATTPVKQEVIDAMLPLLKEDFGNPSSIHRYGKKAQFHLQNSRETIAKILNAFPEQIYFTSGGTESNNTIIFGIEKLIEDKKLLKSKHIITSKIEHSSIKIPLEYLENKGWKITWLNVDSEGFIDIEEFKNHIKNDTALVSIIHANNEIGTIQNLKTISDICKKHKALFHTDAVQSFCKIPIDVKDINVDFLSVSSHKIYGPKGTGALYIKSHENILPLIMGGGQENDMRSGTENLPGIVGFSTAAKLLSDDMVKNATDLRKLQINLIEELLINKNVILTGPKPLFRIPGHVSICCKDLEGESLVLQADIAGIAISSGSACSSRDAINRVPTVQPSHVIEAIGIPDNFKQGSLRITLGIENTSEDVKYIAKAIRNILEKLSKAYSSKGVIASQTK